MKDEDGQEIKMTVLKYPIPLDMLEYETEVNGENDKKTIENQNDIKKKTDKLNVNDNTPKISVLKEPVCLDDIDWNKNNESQIYKIKTVQGCFKKLKKVKNKSESWKQNVLIIFENSFVYPFIHLNNKYKCFICSKRYLESNQLKEHIFEHTVKEMSKELTNRVRDKNIKVDVTHLQCKICLQRLHDLEALKIHLKDHGKDIDLTIQDNIIPFKLGDKNFDCQLCGERYLKLRLLIIHMSKHFNNYSCEVCGTVFISLNLLKRHQQIHESGSFPCEKCDKVFNSAEKRRMHTRGVHQKKFIRRCPICPERFNSNYQRTKHLRIVHNQSTGLFRCDTCGREYDLKYTLLTHIRSVHLQEKNHECPMCHSRFFSKHCLTRHMVIHTGEKKFKCEVCGKAYARRKNLKEHSRSHEGGICSVCGQHCGDQSNLVAHINSIHAVM